MNAPDRLVHYSPIALFGVCLAWSLKLFWDVAADVMAKQKAKTA
jgi:hypothetical protein